ncbi:Eco29kI family restriction endonuclease [Paenibacillus sp. MBLB4367]|uniref:Eco29kI family restriction endonuclease n=1 Tax=Paenibacillus sp. MBLB4367 TaxID=3384767 RepID=UPI0039080B9B
MTHGFDEFELDIEKAFRDYLPPFILNVGDAPLTVENILAIPPNKNGVYLLLENQVIRYVGKTDSTAGFHSRLRRHQIHMNHRKNLDPSTITFKAVAIPVFKNADIETMLIDHYNAQWNFSGFGSNDPGKNRDDQDPADFDLQYPIDVDLPLSFLAAGIYECKELLKILARELPYTLRYEKTRDQQDLDFSINIPIQSNLKYILQTIINEMPADKWQATVLYGRVILYPEHKLYRHTQFVIR